jgi:hypothetical protein
MFGYIIDWSLAARGADGRLIEVNPAATGLSRYATEIVRQPAARALPEIAARYASARLAFDQE